MGRVYHSEDHGRSWTDRTGSALPDRYATEIAISPRDPDHLYVSYSGFDAAGPPGHVFRSDDGGHSWRNVSEGLPDIPVNAVQVNPLVAGQLYAGTDTGLYLSHDGAESWGKVTSLPNVGISRVRFSVGARVVAVSTVGRGAWLAPLGAIALPGPDRQ